MVGKTDLPRKTDILMISIRTDVQCKHLRQTLELTSSMFEMDTFQNSRNPTTKLWCICFSQSVSNVIFTEPSSARKLPHMQYILGKRDATLVLFRLAVIKSVVPMISFIYLHQSCVPCAPSTCSCSACKGTQRFTREILLLVTGSIPVLDISFVFSICAGVA